MSGISREAFQAAADRIRTWKRPLLLSHTQPDGDAVGSLMALRHFFREMGIDATALLFDPLHDRNAFLDAPDTFPVLGADLSRDVLDEYDGVVILDTCTYSQLEPIADWLRSSSVAKLAVDHHRTRDDLADDYLIDESAAANCLILYEWARNVGWTIDCETAVALFAGIAMDTGWFRHSNTDHRALGAAAELVKLGVNANHLAQKLFQRESAGRVRLLGTAIATLQFIAGGFVAMMTLSREAMVAAGATQADTEDIVNEPLRISAVRASILLTEANDGVVRVSFRSKTPLDGADASVDLDVSVVAQAFGGGGHVRAAGARVTGSMSDVQERIVRHFEELLANA